MISTRLLDSDWVWELRQRQSKQLKSIGDVPDFCAVSPAK